MRRHPRLIPQTTARSSTVAQQSIAPGKHCDYERSVQYRIAFWDYAHNRLIAPGETSG